MAYTSSSSSLAATLNNAPVAANGQKLRDMLGVRKRRDSISVVAPQLLSKLDAQQLPSLYSRFRVNDSYDIDEEVELQPPKVGSLLIRGGVDEQVLRRFDAATQQLIRNHVQSGEGGVQPLSVPSIAEEEEADRASSRSLEDAEKSRDIAHEQQKRMREQDNLRTRALMWRLLQEGYEGRCELCEMFEGEHSFQFRCHRLFFHHNPKDLSAIYDFWIGFFVFIFVLDLIVMSSIRESPSDETWIGHIVILAILSTIMFMDFVLHLVALPLSLKPYLRYIFSFQGLTDLASFVPFFLILFVDGPTNIGYSDYSWALSLIVLRLFRVARLLRFVGNENVRDVGFVIRTTVHYTSSWKNLLIFLVSLCLIVFGSLIASVEVSKWGLNNTFNGFYWTLQTISSEGYGDLRPETDSGRIICIGASVLGIVSLAIPVGLISATFHTVFSASHSVDIKSIRRVLREFRSSYQALRVIRRNVMQYGFSPFAKLTLDTLWMNCLHQMEELNGFFILFHLALEEDLLKVQEMYQAARLDGKKLDPAPLASEQPIAVVT